MFRLKVTMSAAVAILVVTSLASMTQCFHNNPSSKYQIYNGNKRVINDITDCLRFAPSDKRHTNRNDCIIRSSNNGRGSISSSSAQGVSSYSVDGSGGATDEDFNSLTNSNDWVESTKSSLLENVRMEELAEQATEQELDERKQRLRERSLSGTAKSFLVEVPLTTDLSSIGGSQQQIQLERGLQSKISIGMTLGQVLPGRIISRYELDCDSLTFQTKASPAEAAAEDSDIRVKRHRLGGNGETDESLLSALDTTFSGLIVSSIIEDSPTWKAGVRAGDLVLAVSATIGDTLWPKSTLDGVRSAILSRRAVVTASRGGGSKTIQFQLKRMPLLPKIEAPSHEVSSGLSPFSASKASQYQLTIPRPLGFSVRESTDGSGYVEVASISDSASNLVKFGVKVGDKIVAIGSSLGDQLLWPASSTVEGVIAACTGRLPGQPVTIVFDRPTWTTEGNNGIVAGDRKPSIISTSSIVDVSANTSVTSSLSTMITSAVASPRSISVRQPPTTDELRSRCRAVLKKYTSGISFDDSISSGITNTDSTSSAFSNRKLTIDKFPSIVADKVVDALASASAEIDAYTLHLIMNAYLVGGTPESAIRVFEASTGFAGDGSIDTIPTIIRGKVANSRIQPKESSLNLYTCTNLLRAHATMKDYVSMRRVLLAMEGKSGEIVPLDDKCRETAPWPWTGSLGSLRPDTICYNIAIAAAGHAGDVETAMDWFRSMQPASYTTRSNNSNKKIIPTNIPEVLPIRNQVTYNTIINALITNGLQKDAFQLFDQMKRSVIRPDKYTYTAMIKACTTDNDLQELLYEMKEMGIPTDVITYNTIIKSLCDQRRWTDATRVISEMESLSSSSFKKKNILPDTRTYGLLMNGMLKEGKANSCLALFETACSNSNTASLTENVYLYTIAITAAAKLSDYERALELLARMKARGLQPSLKTLTAVMGACLAAASPSSSIGLTQQQKAAAEVAAKIFRVIKNPDGYAIYQGIQALCESGNLSEAADYMNELKTSSKNDMNLFLSGKQVMKSYQTIVAKALESGNYDLARLVFIDLLRKGYIPSKAMMMGIFDVFQLNRNSIKKRNRQLLAHRSTDTDIARFQFLLFIVDTLQQRNLPIESYLYRSVGTLGRELKTYSNCAKKTLLFMDRVKTSWNNARNNMDTESDQTTDKVNMNLSMPTFEGWEDLFIKCKAGSIDEMKLVHSQLPSLRVRS